MSKYDYSKYKEGFRSIYIYELGDEAFKKYKKSFNYKAVRDGGWLIDDFDQSLSPLYIGETGLSAFERAQRHFNGEQVVNKYVSSYGLRNDESWPKGLMTDLMDEVPFNTIVPSSLRYDFEISTGVEMAIRGHLVFGPTLNDIPDEKYRWSGKWSKGWSGIRELNSSLDLGKVA